MLSLLELYFHIWSWLTSCGSSAHWRFCMELSSSGTTTVTLLWQSSLQANVVFVNLLYTLEKVRKHARTHARTHAHTHTHTHTHTHKQTHTRAFAEIPQPWKLSSQSPWGNNFRVTRALDVWETDFRFETGPRQVDNSFSARICLSRRCADWGH